jgi:hypothetical protein
MAAKKPFINPLTRSSENELHIPEAPNVVASTVQTGEEVKQKKRTFEETHERFSTWINKDLKIQFLELVEKRGTTKTALLNEAIEHLMHKEDRKPYTRHSAED